MSTIVPGRLSRLDPTLQTSIAAALQEARYELVPTASARPAADAVPPGGTVTITASPRRGIGATVDLAVELSRVDLRVVPHLAARLIRDRGHLGEVTERLTAAGVDELFVIGGDGEPRGEFSEALQVLRFLEESGSRFTVGIAGYPEGHPLVSDEELESALAAKQPHASYLVTQMCFDASAVSEWIAKMRTRGIELPVLIGLPGAVAVTRLLPVAARIGVGDSIRFLTRQRGLWRKLLSPTYSPTGLLAELAPTLADPSAGVAGLHFYTFNQVETTEEWRRRLLGELEEASPS